MAKAPLKLAPVRVGIELPWKLWEDYRRIVSRHNLRVFITLAALPLLVFALLLPDSSGHTRQIQTTAALLGPFLLFFGVAAYWARRDGRRFGVSCPTCAQPLFAADRRMRWRDGDTQSIAACPRCKRVLQCARPGITLMDPVEGMPLPATAWEKRRWILLGGMAALVASGILVGCGMLYCSRPIRVVGFPAADKRPFAALCLLLICGTWLVSVRGIVRLIEASAKKAGLTCSRCLEPLTGRRVVCDETAAPPRITCLACGTLMRVEA